MKRIQPCQLATACLPWKKDLTFDEAIFRREVRLLRAAGLTNLYINGTAGEGYALTNAVFKKVAEVFFEEMRGGGLCQLGVIGMSVAQIRERIDMGMEIGFRDFQVSLPCWGTVTDQELARFFKDVLDPYPQARFLHYNLIRSGRKLTGGDYARLAVAHPNLIATKSGGNTLAALLSLLGDSPQLCHFVTELDYAMACLLGGTCGHLVSISAIHPGRSREFFEAGQKGDHESLKRMTHDLKLILDKVIAVVAQDKGHMDGAYDKLFSRLADPEFPLDLLSPYQGASTAAFEALKTWLVKEMPQWAVLPEK